MISQRPLLITVMVISMACYWLVSGVNSSPVSTSNNGEEGRRSSVPAHTLPSGPMEDSEIGQPLTEEELNSNISISRAEEGRLLVF